LKTCDKECGVDLNGSTLWSDPPVIDDDRSDSVGCRGTAAMTMYWAAGNLSCCSSCPSLNPNTNRQPAPTIKQSQILPPLRKGTGHATLIHEVGSWVAPRPPPTPPAASRAPPPSPPASALLYLLWPRWPSAPQWSAVRRGQFHTVRKR